MAQFLEPVAEYEKECGFELDEDGAPQNQPPAKRARKAPKMFDVQQPEEGEEGRGGPGPSKAAAPEGQREALGQEGGARCSGFRGLVRLPSWVWLGGH